MSAQKNNSRAFGLPSVPRQTMPSMFQILSWTPQKPNKVAQPENNNNNSNQNKQESPKKQIKDTVQHDTKQKQQRILQNLSQVKSQADQKIKKRPQSVTKHYQLYQYQNVKKRTSQSAVKTQPPQVSKPVVVKQKTKQNLESDEIQKRLGRIKQFGQVTRDLPNSAFTTYYGKPAFEAYGRANSNPNLLTHNVMPHKGQNQPKNVQSYYSALIKGKKSSVSYIPRRPFQQIKASPPEQQPKNINIPMQKPDLVNHVRFSSVDPNQKQKVQIPSNKVAPIKQKKLVLQSKKKQPKPKQIVQQDDGLKYLNTRQNLLKIIQSKKTNASRLAYKNEDKMKESTHQWDNVKKAGKQSKRSDKVSQLLKITDDYTY